MESFDWLKPSLLWRVDGEDFREEDFFRPFLLQFSTDDFMDDYFRLLGAADPDGFAGAIARPEGPNKPLKLFQPIHMRYYLVCASLCCRLPGFPDREVRAADGESVFFVIRKLVSGVEQGWIIDRQKKGRWKPLDNLGDGEREERLPLFPSAAGTKRQLFFGYVPVASRETYQPDADSDLVVTSDTDPRPARFNENITLTLTSLIDTKTFGAATDTAQVKAQAEEVSLFLLFDLDTFLIENLPRVADALHGQPRSLNAPEQTLVNYLKDRTRPDGKSVADAIKDVNGKRQQIADLAGGDDLPARYDLREFQFPGATAKDKTKDLEDTVLDALPAYNPQAAPTPRPTGAEERPKVEVQKFLARPNERYALRCFYERPQCDPPQTFTSERSELFDLASALDPEAPARQLRLELPRDVSIAGLRKFKKGVGFAMSEAMRNKVARISGFEKALLKDEDIGDEGGETLGFICSFSFQIIFIVAFFLLLMFALILNIVFWWMAFFRICLPFPMKAK